MRSKWNKTDALWKLFDGESFFQILLKNQLKQDLDI